MERTKEELELLNRLNIKDFRHLKVKHALELASSLKDLSPEIQMKIIDQVPNFTNFLSSSISICKDEIDNILKSNNEELFEIFSSYNGIMNSLQSILDTDDSLSFEQKMEIINQIGFYADKKAELHINNQSFKDKFMNKLLGVSAFAAMAVLAVLGVNGAFDKDDDSDQI